MAVNRMPRPWPLVGGVLLLAVLVYRTDQILMDQAKAPLRIAVGPSNGEGELWQFVLEPEVADSMRWWRPVHALPDGLEREGRRREAMEAWDVLRQGDSTDFWAWKAWGQGMLRAGDATSAIGALTWAVQLDSTDFELWQSIGVAKARAGFTGAAVRAFQQAVALRPNLTRARLNAGISLLKEEQWAAALGQLDTAKQFATSRSMAKVEAYRGQALRALGRLSDAESAYREAVSRDPDQLLARLGLAALEDEPANRVVALEKLRALEPNRGVVHWTLANAYLEADMPLDAEASFDRALELAPDEVRFAGDLMRFHLDRDQVDRAKAVLSERFAAAEKSPERLFLEAKVLSGNGDDAGAVARYDAALQASDGAMAQAWLNRGVALRRLGRIEEAIASYRSALEQRPGYPEAWYNIGVGRSEQGEHARAAEAYERCLQLDPRRSRAWYNLGMQRVRMGNESDALPAFEAAIAVQPQYASAWYNLAVFQRKLGHPSAGASLDSVITRFPENEKGWFIRGAYRADLGDLDEAIRSYQKAIEVEPGYVAAWNSLAGCLHDAGDEEGALSAFQEAVQLAPDVPGYRFNLGLQYERMKSWDEAIVQYRRAHQLDAHFFRPLERIVKLDGQGRAGDWGLWARDRQLTQDSLVVFGPDSIYELGRSLHRLGFTSEARTRYDDAVALGKQGVWPRYWSSKAAEESGLKAEAIAGYRLVLNEREDFKFALYRLALLLADEDVEEARVYWDRLVAVHPDFAEEKSTEKP